MSRSSKPPRLIERRQFIREGGLLAAGAPLAFQEFCRRGSIVIAGHLNVAGEHHKIVQNFTKAPMDPNRLKQFVDPLPIVAVAKPDGLREAPDGSGLVPYYLSTMSEFHAKLHRDLPATRVWGHNKSIPAPTFVVQSGTGLMVEWRNELPQQAFLPIDHTLHGAELGKPDVRTVVHLHGAKVQPDSDGFPEDWFTPGESAVYYYPNQQRATTLWYHDHALGLTRLNNYAGMTGMFVIHDDFETGLNLPSGQFDNTLMIYDRTFDNNGQLNYPISGDPAAPHIPEFFGNVMLANGKVFPYMNVQPRKYRFRILNASNSRFLGLSLSSGQSFIQIGTDQGLMPGPVELPHFILVPSERADIVIDFSTQAGNKVILNNDAPAPYPGGGEFVPPNIMQFNVAKRLKHPDTSVVPPALLPFPVIDPSTAVRTRELVLIEYDDDFGVPFVDLLDNANWDAPISEDPVIDTVEIWDLLNTTDDAHPIHIHLIGFQVVERIPFDGASYPSTGKIVYTGPPRPPDPNEVGWKDVVRALPNYVTRVIAKFEGFTGRYVWHCHILEHEDNEMMRPFEVLTEEAAALRGSRPAKTVAALKLRRRSADKFGRG